MTAHAWRDALDALALFALDPAGFGGVCLRAGPGPARERWLSLLAAAARVHRLPPATADDQLLGALDVAATLAAGRPVHSRGLLAACDGGVLVIAMAERMSSAAAARITMAQDTAASRFGFVLLDEGASEDERPPASLLERAAFHVELAPAGPGHAQLGDIATARDAFARMPAADAHVDAFCTAAAELGIASLRAPLFALRAARAAAALAGRRAVEPEDAALAARLVLAPRATVVPQARDAPPPDAGDEAARDTGGEGPAQPLEDVVLDAAAAALPADLLAGLAQGGPRRHDASGGRAGRKVQGHLRGRPAGARRGDLRAGARLDLIATLRAAAPWQPLRPRREGLRIAVHRDDLRVKRFIQRSRNTAIFVVDASGSQALHRLAEAKGAVALILADCYVRRDSVALLAFRGARAELLLPPTRSLARARRCLASLPGGGGTPLAAALDAAVGLALAVRARGDTPTLVLLTDGQANVARDGAGGRAQAELDALAAARTARARGLACLLIDTSPQPRPAARKLAEAMDARYLPLPHAASAAISQAVRAAGPAR